MCDILSSNAFVSSLSAFSSSMHHLIFLKLKCNTLEEKNALEAPKTCLLLKDQVYFKTALLFSSGRQVEYIT